MRLSSNEAFISTRIAWKRTGRGTWQQAVPSETPSQRCEQALELAKGMKRNKLPKDLNIDNQGLPHSKRGRTGPSDQKDCKRRLCGGTPTATQVYVFLPQTTHSFGARRVCARTAPLFSKHGVSDDLEHLAAVEPSGGGGFVIADEAFRRGDAGAQRGEG